MVTSMFIGREKELHELTSELSNQNKKSAILIYGKRRVGKSTLIKEASKSWDGTVIHHICVNSTFEGNMTLCKGLKQSAMLRPYDLLQDRCRYGYEPKTVKKTLSVSGLNLHGRLPATVFCGQVR